MKLTTEDRKALRDAINVLAVILQQASPEVPERIEEWPEDESTLGNAIWEDREGDHWRYLNAMWQVWDPKWRKWGEGHSPDYYLPLTRTTDPSLPRTWNSLADIPEDVERAAGKYRGYSWELARSPLSGTGWMMRIDLPYARQQWVEYMNLDEDELTDIEEAIDHE